MTREQPLLSIFEHPPLLHIDHVLPLFIANAGDDDDDEGGDQIEVESVVPYHDSDSESEPEQLMFVSEFELLSGSDEEESTALDALAFSYVRGRGRGHAVVSEVYSSDDDMPSSDDDMPSVTATANLLGRDRGQGRARTAGSSQPGVGPSS